MNQSQHLYKLQLLDNYLDKHENRIKEINQVIERDRSIQEAENLVQKAKEDLYHAHHLLQTLEDNAHDLRVKIDTSESSLYGGKIVNPKELQDIQAEIASLKRRLAVLEDDQISAMLNEENLEKGQKLSIENLDKTKLAIGNLHSNLLSEKNDLVKENEKTKVERSAILASISSENIMLYQSLRTQKHGVAVALIIDDTCSACGSTIRPAERQAAKSPLQISFCSSCGRILYAD